LNFIAQGEIAGQNRTREIFLKSNLVSVATKD